MGAEQKNKPAKKTAKPAKAEDDPKQQPWWFNQPLPIDRFTGWLGAWTCILSIATLGLGFTAFLQWRELRQTDEHIAGQLEVMRAGQRAWVKVESVEISDTLVFIGDGAGIGLTVGLRNVGNLPAVRVWPIIHLYPDIHFAKGFPPACEAAAREQQMGFTLFPNELNNTLKWHGDIGLTLGLLSAKLFGTGSTTS